MSSPENTSIIPGAGVSSFNGRTGAVTLSEADILAKFAAKGGILLGTGAGTGTELAIGATGKVLTVVGGTAAWVTPASGSNTFHGASLEPATNQALNSGGGFAIVFDAANSLFDTDGYLAGASTDITIPVGLGGYYVVTAEIEWAVAATGFSRYAFFEVNGSFVQGAASGDPQTTASPGNTNNLSAIFHLADGDILNLKGFQDSGAPLNSVAPSTAAFVGTRLQLGRLGV